MLQHLSRLAALALLVPFGSAQLPAYTVVAEAVGSTAQPGEVRQYRDIRGGEDSGWIATVQLGPDFEPSSNAFFGAFSATDPLGPRLLREPATLAGVQP